MASSACAVRSGFGGRGRLDGKLMEQGGESASSPSAGYLLRPIYTKMTEFRIGLKFHE